MRLGLAGASLLLISCGTSAPPPPKPLPSIASADRPYILDPLQSYEALTDPVLRDRVRAAYRALDAGGDPAAALAAAEAVLEEDGSFGAASVLAAQAYFLRGQDNLVVDRLLPVLDAQPGYLAALMLLSRSFERLGEVAGAYDGYRALASSSSLAADHARRLEAAAHETVLRDFSEELAAERFEDARRSLELLHSWSPDDLRTMEATYDFAEAIGDDEQRYQLARLLYEADASDQRQQLLGQLEFERGEVRAALDLLEPLLESSDESELAELVDAARFQWRLRLLPKRIQEMTEKSELARSDWAALLEWLFPSVRYADISNPPIASDILDHPDQASILKVLSLKLMDYDETVHRFHPARDLSPRQALAGLLAVLQSAEQPVSCLQGETLRSPLRRSEDWVCAKAAQCQLIAEVGECVGWSTVSGVDAKAMLRHCLRVLEGV